MNICCVIVSHFVVKDAAPTKALPGMALRHRRHDSSNRGEDLIERASDELQQQNHAEAIEAEQRERLKQRFGAHDGL
jgi:hypothetical protein